MKRDENIMATIGRMYMCNRDQYRCCYHTHTERPTPTATTTMDGMDGWKKINRWNGDSHTERAKQRKSENKTKM